MADAIDRMLVEPVYYERIREGLDRMRKKLGNAGVSERVASVVREMLAG